MAAQIMSDPPPKARDADHPTHEELAAMVESYMAYAGTYHYDPETKTVTHHVQLSNDPTDLGGDLVRTVEFDGDRVTLTTTKPYDLAGEKVINRLTWQRIR